VLVWVRHQFSKARALGNTLQDLVLPRASMHLISRRCPGPGEWGGLHWHRGPQPLHGDGMTSNVYLQFSRYCGSTYLHSRGLTFPLISQFMIYGHIHGSKGPWHQANSKRRIIDREIIIRSQQGKYNYTPFICSFLPCSSHPFLIDAQCQGHMALTGL
jgi:hypothetical protein